MKKYLPLICGISGEKLTTEEIKFFRDYKPWGIILFERNEIMSVDKKAMIGSRAQMDFGNDNRSFIGATALFYDQSVINEKVEVGYEPIRNFIWDFNVKLSFDLDGLKRVINKLPIIKTEQQ